MKYLIANWVSSTETSKLAKS